MKHPLHPLFTHFPIALWLTSLLWDFLGLWRGDPFWWQFSYWSIAAGLAISLLTVATGFVDYIRMPHRNPEETVVMKHIIIVFTAACLFAGSFFARLGVDVPEGGKLYLALGLSVAGSLLLIVGAWYGGELVHRYGIGRIQEAEEQDQVKK